MLAAPTMDYVSCVEVKLRQAAESPEAIVRSSESFIVDKEIVVLFCVLKGLVTIEKLIEIIFKKYPISNPR
jgi:hypothetical protein